MEITFISEYSSAVFNFSNLFFPQEYAHSFSLHLLCITSLQIDESQTTIIGTFL